MRYAVSICMAVFIAALAISGCTSKEEKVQFPETSPEEVVLRFYELLAAGGKLTTKEAQSMVSTHYMEFDPNDFRKWTRDFNSECKIKIIDTVLPTGPNENGMWVAEVNMEVMTPSSFGDYFTTHSKMHLILDRASHEWKIDFMGDTIDEDHYRKAPAEAKAQ